VYDDYTESFVVTFPYMHMMYQVWFISSIILFPSTFLNFIYLFIYLLAILGFEHDLFYIILVLHLLSVCSLFSELLLLFLFVCGTGA
jgi:hypothetical protein